MQDLVSRDVETAAYLAEMDAAPEDRPTRAELEPVRGAALPACERPGCAMRGLGVHVSHCQGCGARLRPCASQSDLDVMGELGVRVTSADRRRVARMQAERRARMLAVQAEGRRLLEARA